jgi:hypothetical protein
LIHFYLESDNICFSHAKVIFLHLGVLSIKPICNKYGSTTSSRVPSSSPKVEARVFNPTGHPANFLKIFSKYFLSK